MTSLDVGLLLLRLGLAALLTGHATQKLFGWFRGNGIARTGTIFDGWGFRPGAAMAVVAGVCELFGAGSIALGLLMPAGCAVIIGTMVVAAAPNARNGLWAHLGGSEVAVVYADIAIALAFTGPGRYSLDNALGLQALHSGGWAVAAVVIGGLASIAPLLRRRAVLHSTTPE